MMRPSTAGFTFLLTFFSLGTALAQAQKDAGDARTAPRRGPLISAPTTPKPAGGQSPAAPPPAGSAPVSGPPAAPVSPTAPSPPAPAPSAPARSLTDPSRPIFLSTAGSDLVQADRQTGTSTGDSELRDRVQRLEAELTALKSKREPAEGTEDVPFWQRIRFTGFVQPQFIYQIYNASASPNADANGRLPPGVGANDIVAKNTGLTTNPDFFRLRRARIMATATPVDFARIVIEIEPLPRGGSFPGSGTLARTLEAVAIARFSPSARLELAMGQFKVPFGFEILQSDADRPFVERSWMEQNLFPSEFDIGARAAFYGNDNKLKIFASVINDAMLGEPTYAAQPDLNRAKDFTLRADYDFGPVDVGLNGYLGTGHRVDPASLRFKQFPRMAANAELGVHRVFSKALGMTKAFAEATFAQNLDRGVNYAFALPDIPTNLTDNVVNRNELGFFFRAEQDVTRWVTLGLRYDYYTPDTALSDNQRHTFSGVAAVHITTGLQVMLEFDAALDSAHAPGSAVATREIDTGSGVLQGRF